MGSLFKIYNGIGFKNDSFRRSLEILFARSLISSLDSSQFTDFDSDSPLNNSLDKDINLGDTNISKVPSTPHVISVFVNQNWGTIKLAFPIFLTDIYYSPLRKRGQLPFHH